MQKHILNSGFQRGATAGETVHHHDHNMRRQSVIPEQISGVALHAFHAPGLERHAPLQRSVAQKVFHRTLHSGTRKKTCVFGSLEVRCHPCEDLGKETRSQAVVTRQPAAILHHDIVSVDIPKFPHIDLTACRLGACASRRKIAQHRLRHHIVAAEHQAAEHLYKLRRELRVDKCLIIRSISFRIADFHSRVTQTADDLMSHSLGGIRDGYGHALTLPARRAFRAHDLAVTVAVDSQSTLSRRVRHNKIRHIRLHAVARHGEYEFIIVEIRTMVGCPVRPYDIFVNPSRRHAVVWHKLFVYHHRTSDLIYTERTDGCDDTVGESRHIVEM